MQDGRVVGTITSGDYGHRVAKNLAYAFVEADLSATGTALTLDLCGAEIAATVIPPSPYDPDLSRARA